MAITERTAEIDRGERLIRSISIMGLAMLPVLAVFVHVLLIYRS
jgi:hypothetical protein